MISTRRHALTRMAAGFGSVGLAGLLAYDNPPHFAPKAKRIIYLVLNGGLSQIDSFDPKPMVDKYDGQAIHGHDAALPLHQSSQTLASSFQPHYFGAGDNFEHLRGRQQ